jgi:hypothetical protein
VTEEVGDEHRVGTCAQQLGGECMPEDVRAEPAGWFVAEADLLAEGGDDGPGGAVGQPSASPIELQRRALGGGGPGGPSQVAKAERSSNRVRGSSRSLPPSRPLPRMRRLPLRADRTTSSRSRPTTSLMRSPA